MPNNLAIANRPVTTTSMGADFGHMPIGKFGDRSVSVGVANAPRMGAATAQLTPPPSLGSRILNALTPSSVRADSKVRQHLHDYSAQLSKTLGTVAAADISTPQGKQKLESALSALAKASVPLQSQGVQHKDAFHGQMEMRLGKMSLPERAALRQGLSDAGKAGINAGSPAGDILSAMTKKLNQAPTASFKAINAQLMGKVEQTLSPIIEQLKNHAAGGAISSGFTETYDQLSSAIDQLAEKYAPDSSNAQGLKDFKAGLLKEAFETCVGDSPQGMGLLMNLMPAETLKQLIFAEPVYSNANDFTTELIISGQIGLRDDKFESAVRDFGQALLAHDPADAANDASGPLQNPQGFAKEIVGFQKNLEALADHKDMFDMKQNPAVDSTLAAVLSHLEELLRPSNLNLGELSNQQIGALSESLQKLGVERANSTLASEGGNRRAAAEADYSQTFTSLMDAVQGNKLGTTLTLLETLNTRGNAAMTAFEATGDDFDGADKLMQLRANLMDDAIAKLSPEVTASAYSKLSGKESRVLIDGMQDVANQALRANETQGKLFFNASVDLQLLSDSLKSHLESQGVKLPDLPDPKGYDASMLSSTDKTAIQKQYGFEVNPNGVRYTAGLAAPVMQKALEQSVAAGALLKPEGHRNTGVTNAFYMDLGRADFTLTQPNGAIVNLVNREKFGGLDAETQDIRRQNGADQLRQFLGNDPEMLLFVTNNIHQGLLSGLQGVNFSNQSPIQLEDGTPGQLSGKESIAYNFSRNEEGDVQVGVSYSIKTPRVLLDPASGNVIPTNPATSGASFTFAVTIGPDKTIAVSDPVRFEYSANKSTWASEEFPQPLDFENAIDSSTPGVTEGFAAFLAKEFSSENLNFIKTLQTFNSEPTLLLANQIVQRFFGKDALEEINIAAPEALAIADGMAKLQGDQFNPDDAKLLLKPALDQVMSLTKNDSYKRYVASNGM